MHIGTDTVDEIVKLRKAYKSLKEISEIVDRPFHYVREILREELGDSYSKYCWKRGFILTPDIIKKIVDLRKQEKKYIEISKSVEVPKNTVALVLRKELGRDTDFYNYKKESLPQDIVTKIICLRKRGYTLKEIEKEIPDKFEISLSFLIDLLKEKLKHNYRKYCYRMTPHRHRHRHRKSIKLANIPCSTANLSFYELFDRITAKAPFNEYQRLKEEGYRFMQDIREKIKKGAYLRNESKLSPIVLYLLFKMKRINFALEHYLRLSKITRREFRKRLKYVLPYYPEYQIRDKKALVIEGISNLQDKFNFSTRFFNTSMVLLDRFWHHISNTKEEVITGVLSILTMIKLNVNSVQHNTICNSLGIRSSSVHYHLKHSIGIVGFQGFKKSAHIVRAML